MSDDVRWLAEYVEDENVAFRIGRVGDRLVAEWMGLARLVARRDGSESELVVAPGADPDDVEKIRRGGARLLLRHLEGKLAIHGAVVAKGDRAVLLLGRSGQGKSTLAAKACLRAGMVLLADDAVVVEREDASWIVLPSEKNHWLDDASRRALGLAPVTEGKAPTPAPRTSEKGARLAAILELAWAETDAPRISAMPGAVASMAALVPQVVRFVLDEPEMQRRELEVLADLVATVPVLRLDRAKRFDALDRTVDLVEGVLDSAT